MNRRAATLCTAALLIAVSAAAKVLPIYIEDNHAGTFYWLAQNLDLDKPCTLILFDAHIAGAAQALFSASTGLSRLCPLRSRE
ncbi:MAG: hypothetical protein DME55_05540 [Verrucomicrobia bacterium]|nr:MAG: hypothetical protein DME55_05540 [Verrucomicrobiota bacterium]